MNSYPDSNRGFYAGAYTRNWPAGKIHYPLGRELSFRSMIQSNQEVFILVFSMFSLVLLLLILFFSDVVVGFNV